MPFKILSILTAIALSLTIPVFSILEYTKVENTKEGSLLQQDPTDTFSKDALKHLQDIHNFESIFDDSYFGGMSYE